MKNNARTLTPTEWLPVVIIPTISLAATQHCFPPWMVMWAIAFSIYFGLKWLTWRNALRSDPSLKVASRFRTLAYLLGWPGMNAKDFLNDATQCHVPKPTAFDWGQAFANFILGTVIIWLVFPNIPSTFGIVRGWIGLSGIAFLLHFGLFRILSCFWRWQGFQAPSLMNNPIASTKLSEFWGSRWNTAFRDLTRDYLFKPLSRLFTPTTAVFIGFFFSGIVHDLAISVPAQAGYGLPTLYFLIQSIGIWFERSRFGKALSIEHSPRGRIFAALFIVVPAGLLFHRSFIEVVAIPFLDAITVPI